MNKLNCKIAQTLGYRLEFIEQKEFAGQMEYRVALIAPDNHGIHSAWYSAPDDFAYVFNHVQKIGKLPGCDWEHDLNAALPLALGLPQLRIKTGGAVIFIEYNPNDKWSAWKTTSKTAEALAQVICEAWLEWKGVEYE